MVAIGVSLRPRSTVGKRNVGDRALPVEVGDQAAPREIIGNAVVHRIIWQQRVARKIHLRHQPLHQPQAEQREVKMRRPPRVVMVAPGISAGLDRQESIIPFGIGQRPTAAGEIGIERRIVVVDRMRIASGRVGLPQLDQRVRHRPGVFIEQPSRNDNALA